MIDRRLGSPERLHDLHRAAYDDGTFVGFCLGVAACCIAWLFLSGMLNELLLILVRAGLTLSRGY